MDRSRVNIAVGIFVILGIVALAYLSISLGQVSFLSGGGYYVTADFPSVGGLKAGSNVEIAGVEIGRDDSIASIKTKGLIGEKYIRISPGGSDKIIGPNGKIREVEAPVDFEELLSKYIFGKV